MESSSEGASECNRREAECLQEWSSDWPYPSSAPGGYAWGWAHSCIWSSVMSLPKREVMSLPKRELGCIWKVRHRAPNKAPNKAPNLCPSCGPGSARGWGRGSGRGFWARRESSLGCLGWGCRWCCDRSRRFARTSRLPNKDGTPRRSNGVERRWNGAAPWHVSSRVARARATRLMKEVISGHPDSSAAIIRSHQ